MSTDKDFANWLHEDVERLRGLVTRLERIGHAEPCPTLKDHLRRHEKSQDRWWLVILRLVIVAIIGAASSIFALAASGKISL